MDYIQETIQAIQELDRKVSAKEWNKIAKKHGFLNSKTLKYISGKDFATFSKLVRKK